MNKKSFRHILVALVISTIVSFLSELLEGGLGLKICGAVGLSIIFSFLGIIIDRKIEQRAFDKKILNIVFELAQKKKNNELKSAEVRKIMKFSIKEIVEIMNHVELRDTGNNGNRVKMKCSVCQEDHEADEKLKCTNCRLDSDKWSYLNTELSKNHNS